MNTLYRSGITLPYTAVCRPAIEQPCELFVGYLLLDAFIGNTDRHHENRGILQRDTCAELAPSYDQPMPCLFVAWQNPETRRMRVVARLHKRELDGRMVYEFVYVNEATKVEGFQPFMSFPDLDVAYHSDTLFPFFTNHVIPATRRDYPRYVKELGLSSDDAAPRLCWCEAAATARPTISSSCSATTEPGHQHARDVLSPARRPSPTAMHRGTLAVLGRALSAHRDRARSSRRNRSSLSPIAGLLVHRASS